MKLPRTWQDESGLVRHGSVLMIGTLAGAACNAGFHMAVGRTLPNAEYGSLGAMLGVILVTSTPMLAVQNTLAHFTSHLEQAGRRGEILALFWHWLALFAAVSAAVVAGAVVFRAPLAALWDVPATLIVLTFTVLAVGLWMNLFYGVLQGLQAFGWLAWVPQAWGAVRMALGWAFTALISATAVAAVWAQGAGVLAVLALGALALVRMHLPHASAAARPR